MEFRRFRPPRQIRAEIQRVTGLELMTRAVQQPLTLVQAPAGYGKTTLVSQFLIAKGNAYLWYPLSQSDDDISQWSKLLIKGLITSYPEHSGVQESATIFEQMTDVQRLDLFTHCLSQLYPDPSTPFYLILDDYHHLNDEKVHQAFLYLLDSLPIQCRVIMISRVIPPFEIERMQANGELFVIGSDICKFNEEESLRFLSECTPAPLTTQVQTFCLNKTQGWPAALQLMSLNLNQEPIEAVLEAENLDQSALYKYFAEQVFNHLTPELQRFLLCISPIKEFTLELCDALWEPGNADELLAELERASLFLQVNSADSQWRKLHDLFREFLLDISECEVEPILICAAQWLQENGFLQNALDYYLSAQAFEQAARIITQMCESHFLDGDMRELFAWLEQLPQDIIHRDDTLLAFYVWCLPDQEKTSIGLELLDRAEASVVQKIENFHAESKSAKRLHQLYVYIMLFRAYINRVSGRFNEARSLSQKFTEYAQRYQLRGVGRGYLGQGQDSYLLGEHDVAVEFLNKSLSFAKLEKDRFGLIVAVGYLVNCFYLQGRLKEAVAVEAAVAEWYRQERLDNLPQVKIMNGVLMEVYRESNQLKVCGDAIEAGLHYCESGVPVSHRTPFEYAKIQLGITLSDFDMVQEAVDSLRVLLPELENSSHALTYGFPSLSAVEAISALVQGDVNRAAAWANHRAQALQGDMSFLSEREKLIAARILCFAYDRDLALTLLQELETETLKHGRMLIYVHTLVVKVLYYVMAGNELEAKQALSLALTEGAKLQLVRTFIDMQVWGVHLLNWARSQPEHEAYLSSILPEQDQAVPSPVDEIQESKRKLLQELSKRELAVLQLISEGCPNKEIARKLFISPNTVKTFVSSILRKLEIRNRTEAASMYRDYYQD